MKIIHPSISTNKATSWYHHYLTLATHVLKRQRDLRKTGEGYIIPSSHKTNLVNLAKTRDTAKSMVLHRY
jgi:hypothetical protein